MQLFIHLAISKLSFWVSNLSVLFVQYNQFQLLQQTERPWSVLCLCMVCCTSNRPHTVLESGPILILLFEVGILSLKQILSSPHFGFGGIQLERITLFALNYTWSFFMKLFHLRHSFDQRRGHKKALSQLMPLCLLWQTTCWGIGQQFSLRCETTVKPKLWLNCIYLHHSHSTCLMFLITTEGVWTRGHLHTQNIFSFKQAKIRI